MYKLSYVVRVTAPDLEELKRRCNEVKDFYDDLNVKPVSYTHLHEVTELQNHSVCAFSFSSRIISFIQVLKLIIP